MSKYWRDLIHIPDAVQASDFVLKLSEGVQRAQTTVDNYVVTQGIAAAFDQALGLIGSSVQSKQSKGTYLHGSFGSGKSHFMAVLDLLLDQEHSHRVRKLNGLSSVIIKHDKWLGKKKFLMVPYHFLTATNVESCILGGYVDYIKTNHPDAPLPPVYRSKQLIDNAQDIRNKMGNDDSFFALLGEKEGGASWFSTGWDAESFEAAASADPGSEEHLTLVSALLTNLLSSMSSMASTSQDGAGFVGMDDGLAIISQHAKSLGYDGLVLFLDELILWLSQRAANLDFVKTEAEKLSKLVEAQNANRPIPIISFVARQRSLTDFVGNAYTGQDRATFDFSIQSLQGRFDVIRLEDRDLPLIVHERLLKPTSADAKEQIVQSFESFTKKTNQRFQELMRTMETDAQAFKQTYPFSPALIQSLVALSTFLQRERTALRMLLKLLVDQRDELMLGHVVPVGDLWDVVSEGNAPVSEALRRTYQTALNLWEKKLRPMLVNEYGFDPADDPTNLRRKSFDNDARLLKTLLIASLVPEVEALKDMTISKLTALNISAVNSPLPGTEEGIVLGKLRKWATIAGEIRLTDEPHNQRVSLQLSTLDVEVLLDRVEAQDAEGARRRKVRDLLFQWLGLEDSSNQFTEFKMNWRGDARKVKVYYRNVREIDFDDVFATDDEFSLFIDYPFDNQDFNPSDDGQRLEAFRSKYPEGTDTLAWLPLHLTDLGKQRLGRLVRIDYVLKHYDEYAKDYPLDQRNMLRPQLESMQSALRQEMKIVLARAYGIGSTQSELVNTSHHFSNHFVSLRHGFTFPAMMGLSFDNMLPKLFQKALEHKYPEMPEIPHERLTSNNARKILDVIVQNFEAVEPSLLIEDKKLRDLLRAYVEPLKLGKMGEDRFQYASTWRDALEKKMQSAEFKEILSNSDNKLKVQHLRDLINPPGEPVGYPRVIQDLIVCLYVTLEQMTLTTMGGPQELAPDKLDAGAILERKELPTQEEWELCLSEARRLFNVSDDFPMLSASAVDRLDEVLKRCAGQYRNKVQNYVKTLLKQGASFVDGGELAIKKSDRYRCATGLEQVLAMKPANGTPTERLKEFYKQVKDEQQVTPMAGVLGNIDSIEATIHKVTWPVLGSAKEAGAQNSESMQALLTSAQEIITSHEYIHNFSELADKSNRLLKLVTQAAQGVKTAEAKPQGAGKTASLESVKQFEVKDAKGLQDLFKSLEAMLAEQKVLQVDVKVKGRGDA